MAIDIGRRGLLLGLLAAPVIVRAGSLMPVRNRWAAGGLVGPEDAVPEIMARPEDFRWGTCDNDINPMALTFTVYGRDERGLLVVEKVLLSPREQARIANARLAT